MMDKRLEEQLERVRQISARVDQIHEQLARNTALMSRDREQLTGSALERARDVRNWRSSRPSGASRHQDCAEAAERPKRQRRAR